MRSAWIVLTGQRGVTGVDSRIVGAVRRPAGPHDTYRLLQQVLEEIPRSVPRVPTYLVTRCTRRGQEWRAAVLSLSENGCLLRSPELLPLGALLHLHFELPQVGPIEVEAEAAYQLIPDTGVVFHGLVPDTRRAIAAYILRFVTA